MAIKDRFADAGARFKGFWSSLKRWQQASLIGTAVVVLGAVLAVAVIAGRTAYSPIFSGLAASDQNKVITFLRDENIPYRTDPDANAILVPTSHVYEARIALAGQGVPSGGIVGYERFDQARAMGQTSFQEKISYYRALEGELTRTIMSLRGVESARVSIVVPEAKLFIEQQQPSTAAVLLKLQPGATFGQEQARSIVHLVASSVEGLSPENVTLGDADGIIPFGDILDDTLTIQDGQRVVLKGREFEKHQERELEQKIRQLLERPFGAGKVQASVRVELNFDKSQTNQRDVIPLQPDKPYGVRQSEQNTEETYEGPAGITGGIPGTTTDIPGYAVNTGTGTGNANYSRTDNVVNYDITTRESQTVRTPGTVRLLTATVLVDASVDQAMMPAWQDEWRNAVANAIGTVDARGDRISIMAVPFDTSAADALRARLEAERRRRMIIGISAFVLLLLAIGAMLALWLRKRRLAMLAAGAADGYQTPSLRELLENPDLMTSQGELSVLEEQLRNYAMNNPEELANLIKNWVVEDI